MTLTYERARRILEGERLPCVMVDLAAFDRNVARHGAVARAGGLSLRPATKSVRVVSLLRRALREPGVRGLMCYSVVEAAAESSLPAAQADAPNAARRIVSEWRDGRMDGYCFMTCGESRASRVGS